MSTKKLSQKDLDAIKYELQDNEVHMVLSRLDSLNFAVGDILNKEERNGESWQLVQTSRDNLQYKKRYQVVYKAEDSGICFVKMIFVNGTTSFERPWPITSIDFENERWRLDDEYLDHKLIGEGEFVISTPDKLLKINELKAKVRKENKAKIVDLSTRENIHKFAKSLKKNQKLWYFDGENKTLVGVIGKRALCTVVSVEEMKNSFDITVRDSTKWAKLRVVKLYRLPDDNKYHGWPKTFYVTEPSYTGSFKNEQ